MSEQRRAEIVRNLPTVGVRVSTEASEIFDVARAAYGHRSLQDLLRPVLEAEAKRLAAVPQIKAMIASSRALRAETNEASGPAPKAARTPRAPARPKPRAEATRGAARAVKPAR